MKSPLVLMMLFLLLTSVGCRGGGNDPRRDYDKVKLGMTVQQVESALKMNPSDPKNPPLKVMNIYTRMDMSIEVEFENAKAVRKVLLKGKDVIASEPETRKESQDKG